MTSGRLWAPQMMQVPLWNAKLPCSPSQKPRSHTLQYRLVSRFRRKTVSQIQQFAHFPFSILSLSVWRLAILVLRGQVVRQRESQQGSLERSEERRAGK